MALPNILFDSKLAAYTKERTERRPIVLSHREREIAELIAQELPLYAVAARLGISNKTVVTYRMRIRAKLGCRDDAGIMRYVSSAIDSI